MQPILVIGKVEVVKVVAVVAVAVKVVAAVTAMALWYGGASGREGAKTTLASGSFAASSEQKGVCVVLCCARLADARSACGVLQADCALLPWHR